MKLFSNSLITLAVCLTATPFCSSETNAKELLQGTYCEKHGQAASMAAVMRAAQRMTKEPKSDSEQLEFAFAMAATYQDELNLEEEAAFALFAYPYRAQIHPNFLLDSRAHKHLFFNLCEANISVTEVKKLDRPLAADCFDKAKAEGRLNRVDSCIVGLFR